jgi:hypothetical protein
LGAGSPFAHASDGVTFGVRLTPRAKRPGFHGVAAGADGRLRLLVAVAAPPVDGAANAALVEWLAAAWRVPKSALSLRSGAGGREKVVHLAGDAAALERRLDGWLEAAAVGTA